MTHGFQNRAQGGFNRDNIPHCRTLLVLMNSDVGVANQVKLTQDVVPLESLVLEYSEVIINQIPT